MMAPSIDELVLRLAIRMARGEYIWTVHFHNTPAAQEAEYRVQLAWLARNYCTLDWQGLVAYIRTGIWPFARPGIIIALFDGYRNNHDVLLPLLDEYGLTGWFFIVTDFIDLGCKSTASELDRLRLEWFPGEYADGRYAMTWQEIRMLTARHVIVNHSASHHPLSPEPAASALDPAILQHEILDSTARFRDNGMEDCQTFTWLFGCMAADHPAAARALAEHGYQLQIGSKGIDLLPKALSSHSDQQTSDDCLGDMIVAAALSPSARQDKIMASPTDDRYASQDNNPTSQINSQSSKSAWKDRLAANVQAALAVCSNREPAISGIPSMLPIPVLKPVLSVNPDQFDLACDFVQWSTVMASLTALTGHALAEKTLDCFCQHLFGSNAKA